MCKLPRRIVKLIASMSTRRHNRGEDTSQRHRDIAPDPVPRSSREVRRPFFWGHGNVMMYDRRWGLLPQRYPNLRLPPEVLPIPRLTFETRTHRVTPYPHPILIATHRSDWTQNWMATSTVKDRLHRPPRAKDPCTLGKEKGPR